MYTNYEGFEQEWLRANSKKEFVEFLLGEGVMVDALFDKVCFGKKNKNQIGRLSVAFSLFFDSFALRECFWDFNFAVRYFCFFSIWFFEDSHHGFL